MEYINRVQLAGKVGCLRRRNVNDKVVASFGLAVVESFRRRTGEAATITTWINCEAWSGRDVDTTALEQGCEVEVLGRISTRKYTDRDGIEKSVTEVKVNHLSILNYPTRAAAPAPAAVADTDGDLPF